MELAAATATKGTSLATSECGEKCYRGKINSTSINSTIIALCKMNLRVN